MNKKPFHSSPVHSLHSNSQCTAQARLKAAATGRPRLRTRYYLFNSVLLILSTLIPALAGCEAAPADSLPETFSSPPTATPILRATIVPPATPSATPPRQPGSLQIISPLESSQVAGGAELRMALYLADHDGLPVEGATVQAQLWTPGGELFGSQACTDRGQGRYLAGLVRLPLRGAGGTWRMVGKATWEDGQQAEVEGTFQADPSLSEMYQSQYGFWVEPPRMFGLGTGFYNLHESGGLHFEDWLYEDGSGYVILDNYRYNASGVTFAALEVHWRQGDLPTDTAAAIAHAHSLAEAGLHHQDPETALSKLAAETSTFQGRPAWRVAGWGQEYYVTKAAAEYPVEWLIFNCPGSDWVWSLILSTNHPAYMKDLRALQKSFECPPEHQH